MNFDGNLIFKHYDNLLLSIVPDVIDLNASTSNGVYFRLGYFPNLWKYLVLNPYVYILVFSVILGQSIYYLWHFVADFFWHMPYRSFFDHSEYGSLWYDFYTITCRGGRFNITSIVTGGRILTNYILAW